MIIEYKSTSNQKAQWQMVEAEIERLMNDGLELRFPRGTELPQYVKDGDARWRINNVIYTPVRVEAGPGPLTIRVLPTLFQMD